MLNRKIERVEIRVNKGEGEILGDFLRKYAIRCGETWQVIAYYTGKRVVGYGMQGGALSARQQLITGKLEPASYPNLSGRIKRCDFKWDGNAYIYECEGEELELKGIKYPITGDTLEVVIFKDKGSCKESENYTKLRENGIVDLEEFYAVPSNHYGAITFNFQVKEISDLEEWLIITATEGVVGTVLDEVSRSVRRLMV